MEVLIVDDDSTIQEILWEVARKAFPGCHPVTVGDLEAALARLAHQKPPDLVLLDLLLPGHTGLDSLKRLRWKFPEVPVVVLRSIQLEFPVIEYRPFRTFSMDQSTSMVVQLYGAVDIPTKVGIITPPGNPPPETQSTWMFGLRVAFDWRSYLGSGSGVHR